MNRQIKKLLFVSLLCIVCSVFGAGVRAAEESGSVGVEGRISSPPPSVGATISVPRDGQTFTELPITVAGICQNGLLVKVTYLLDRPSVTTAASQSL
jgi:hypothetical protein